MRGEDSLQGRNGFARVGDGDGGQMKGHDPRNEVWLAKTVDTFASGSSRNQGIIESSAMILSYKYLFM